MRAIIRCSVKSSHERRVYALYQNSFSLELNKQYKIYIQEGVKLEREGKGEWRSDYRTYSMMLAS